MATKLQLAGKLARVGGHYAGEALRRPTATRRSDVPRHGLAISDAWLSAVLCRDRPDAHVVGHRSELASSGTSTRTTIDVAYDEAGVAAGLPTRIFAKTSATLAQRLVIGGSGALAGETRFFMDLRPHVEIETPDGYWGAYDERTWRSVILMEDIARTRDARFVEPTTSLSREQVGDVVRLLATYHAAFWESPRVTPLKTPRRWIRNLDEVTSIRARSLVGQERAREAIPARLHGQGSRLWDAAVRSLDLVTDAMPHTLLHGDCHVGQTYVTGAGRMGLTDWQTCMRGGWAFDVAYLVASACDPEDRRAWERDLLREYLETLAAGGVDAPSPDDAWLAYRRCLFYPLAAWTLTIGRARYQPRMQPDATCRAVIHRVATAIDDLDAFAAIGV